MSARVFNSILSELPQAVNRPTRNHITNHAPMIRSTLTVSSVRRDLFGPVDHDETKKFVETELAKDIALSSERWGFDFESEQPLSEHTRYQWERVPPDQMPDLYSDHKFYDDLCKPIPDTPRKVDAGDLQVTRLCQDSCRQLYVDYESFTNIAEQISDIELSTSLSNVSDLSSSASQMECSTSFESPKSSSRTPTMTMRATSTQNKHSQSLITDFMRSRKRAMISSDSVTKSNKLKKVVASPLNDNSSATNVPTK